MALRGLVVGYESALSFWRAVRTAAATPADLEGSGRIYGLRETSVSERARRALSACLCDPPLTVAVPDQGSRHTCELVQDRVWPAPVLSEHVIQVGEDVSVCRPAVVFVQLARDWDQVELARVAYELCGTYGLAPWSSEGSAQDLKPLAQVDELRSYANAARALRVRGAKRACDALDLVVPGSNSPLETDVALMLVLTRSRGGYGLGGFRMNEPVEVGEDMRPLVGAARLRPDFAWPDRRVVMELESSRYHGTARIQERDERRRAAYERRGYVAKRLIGTALRSDVATEAFMEELGRALGVERRRPSDSMVRKRRDLRARLFGVQSAEAALRQHRMV